MEPGSNPSFRTKTSLVISSSSDFRVRPACQPRAPADRDFTRASRPLQAVPVASEPTNKQQPLVGSAHATATVARADCHRAFFFLDIGDQDLCGEH